MLLLWYFFKNIVVLLCYVFDTKTHFILTLIQNSKISFIKKMFMRIKNYSILLLLLFSVIIGYSQSKDGVLQGVIRVKFKPQIITSSTGLPVQNSKGKISTGIKSIDKLNATYSATSMKRVFPYSPKFEERHIKHGLHLWYEIQFSSKTDAKDIVTAYSAVAEVEKSEVINDITLVDGGGKPRYVTKAEATTRSSVMPFNDPYLPKQWHYNNVGQTNGTPGDDINLFNAWKITHGTPNVIVSIHDMGVQTDHEDLHANMWVNEAELNGKPGVDDDGNGYIDDVYGVNFATDNGSIDLGGYHACHVAGTIAAVNGNDIGVCGIAGGSGKGDGVRIMTCEILGGVHAADVPASYVYAADMGSVISQNSWGYQSPGVSNDADSIGISYFIAEAGNYPGSPMKGGVVIFASGNSDTNLKMYPGAYSIVISVAALDALDRKASYSNYGNWVNIAAPGGGSDEDAALGTDIRFSNGIMSCLDKNGYGFLDGTSMACPHVSGIAALIVSQYGGPNFTNTDLRTHILTGYNDALYSLPDNSPFIGQLGVGAIDAVLGLANDGKLPPARTTNLSLTGIAQDFATLTWTVPSDPDDSIAWSYQIFVSKLPITLANLPYINTLTYNIRKSVGSQLSFEIDNLQAVTTYNFAIRSIDRWGNYSDISNIITATTNKGPIASFDPLRPAINLYIDVTSQKIATDSVKIINSGEGLLRWTALSHTIITQPLSVKPALQYPVVLDPNAAARGIKSTILSDEPVLLNVIQHDTDLQKGYVDETQNLKMIGETNLKLPNSSAIRFYVDNADGFNLTMVDEFVRYDSTTGPAILEIWKGHDLPNAQLMLAQQFTKTQSGNSYTGIKLNEQIYFEQGSYFWVVCRIPAGNLYPLGIGLETQTGYSDNCYMSLDGDKTWGKLGTLWGDNRVVWAVWAYEFSQRLDKFIKLSPTSGQVASNNFSYIKATVNADTLINGSYKSNIVAYTNQTDNNSIRVPINVTVTGHKPIITSTKRTDFGNVIVGNSTTVKITFKNTGLGRLNFVSPYVFIDNPQFVYVTGNSTIFESGTSQTLTFRFSPTQVGNIFSYAHLMDAAGNNYQFELFGAGLDAPVAQLNPYTAQYNNLSIGDSIQGQFAIKNLGKYPLDYYMPSFANGSNMESIPTNIQKFGYTTKIDSSGVPFVWNDISKTGKDITTSFNGNTDNGIYFYLPLNFMFPFFGKNENFVYITKYGVLCWDNQHSIWSSEPLSYKGGDAVMPNQYISGCGFPMLFQDAGFGHVYYKQLSDRLIVQYDNCPYWDGTRYDGNPGTNAITFQMVLYDNGNINLYYKNSTIEEDLKKTILISMENRSTRDGLLLNGMTSRIWSYTTDMTFHSNTVISITSPGYGLYRNVTNPFGTVLPNDSMIVNYKIKTDSLYLLNYTENLVVVTNDPVHNPSIFATIFNITKGGVSLVKADTSGFDFGSMYRGIVKSNLFHIFNSGKAVDTLISATFDHNYFTITSGNVPEILKPERQLEYYVTMNSGTVGTFVDTLRMVTKNGTKIKIGLKGVVTQGPILNLQTSTGGVLSSITKFPVAGTTLTQSFKIANTGVADLQVTPGANEWATVAEQTVSANTTFNYRWKSSRDFGGPTYEWAEIAGNGGTKITDVLSAYAGQEWAKGIKMPFSFKYYGLPYDTLYVGVSGLVTFTANQDSFQYFWGSAPIPWKGQPDNFIAPMFLFGGPDNPSLYPYTGIYYQMDTSKMIVEFRDFNSDFYMGPPISFEVILFKNGMIKMQYLMPDPNIGPNTVTDYGAIGIENKDGSDGIMVSYNTFYVNSNMSICFYPVRPYTIPASQSKDFVMTLSALNLVANSYADSLDFVSNDPYNLDKKLPVKLVVSGKPSLAKSDSVSFGTVLIDPKVTTLVQQFQVSDPGSANYTINTLSQKYPNDLKIETYININGSYYWTNIANAGVFPASVIAHQAMQFRVTLTPTSAKLLYDTLVINTSIKKVSGADSLFKIPITALIYNSPIIQTNADTIKLYAQTAQFSVTKKVAVNNAVAVNGGYNLNYNVVMNYVRDTTATTSSVTNPVRVTNSIKPQLEKAKLPVTFKTAGLKNGTKNFTQVLAYDTATVLAQALGYGGAQAFYSATSFVAPATGFNLTHVITWFAPGSALTAKTTVYIVGGSQDINSCKVLAQQDFTYNGKAPDLRGKLDTFQLTNNITFYPNEFFFVVFQYDIACEHPQGVTLVPTPVVNRYLYSSPGSAFYDLSTVTTLNMYGWIVRAAEASASYTPWVVLDANTSGGSVAPTKTDSLNVKFDARSATGGDYYANVTLNSNDVKTPTKNVVLYMRKNNAPVFDAPSNLYKVREIDTLNIALNVADYEGDSFTVALGTADPLCALTTSDLTGTTNGGFTSKVKMVKFRYTPDYNSQGNKIFNLVATDSYGNVNKISLNVQVANLNRPPLAVKTDTIFIQNNGKYITVNPSNFFTDPDHDPLNMSAVIGQTSIIGLYSAGSQYLIAPLAMGKTSITFVAADSSGGTATNVVWVRVTKDLTAVDELNPKEDLRAYPNPTTGQLNINIPESMTGNVTIDVYSTLGLLIKSKNIKLSGASNIAMDLTGIRSGLYFVKIRNSKTEKTLKINKQ